MLRDNLAGLIKPMRAARELNPLALFTEQKKSSDDRPQDALKIPAPKGRNLTLTENAASPFHTEPRHCRFKLDHYRPSPYLSAIRCSSSSRRKTSNTKNSLRLRRLNSRIHFLQPYNDLYMSGRQASLPLKFGIGYPHSNNCSRYLLSDREVIIFITRNQDIDSNRNGRSGRQP